MTALKRISVDEIRTRLQERPTFGHFVDLTGSLIDVPLDLSGLVLCGFDFTGSRFEGQVDFSNVTCKGISWFRGVHFSAEADFRTACFFSDARFDGAVYETGANFRGAEFRGIATFDGCCSPAQLDFSDILANGNFSIAGARLKQKSKLSGAVLIGGFWHSDLPISQFDGLDHCDIYGRIVCS